MKNKIGLIRQCILSPGGGDSHMKQTGMLVGNFEFNPSKGDHLGVAQAFCDP